jgi:hypothetical protein
MNYIKNIGLVLVGTVVGGLLAVSFGLNVKVATVDTTPSFGNVYNLVEQNFPKLTVNNGVATTTVSFTTLSTSKGVCLNLTATSSAQPINMTFAASTTGQSTAGVIPVIKFGVCP